MTHNQRRAAGSISLLGLTIVAVAIALAPPVLASRTNHAARAKHRCLSRTSHKRRGHVSHKRPGNSKVGGCVRGHARRRSKARPPTSGAGVVPATGSATYPENTSSGVHVSLVFESLANPGELLSTNPPVRFVMGWARGNPASYPTIYKGIYFPDDRTPNAGTYPLSWFQANHPNWLEYKCDKTTLAFAFNEATRIPVDMSNPEALAWMEKTFFAPPAASGNYQKFDFDNFSLSNGSWEGDRCGHWTGARGTSTWVPQYVDQYNDPAYRAYKIKLAENLASWIHASFPNMAFSANASYEPSFPTDWEALVSHFNIDEDEQGFTRVTNGTPPLDSVWTSKFQHLQAYLAAGHGWQDINQEPARAANTTSAQRQWAIGNYLLLKNNASWMWIGQFQFGEYGKFPWVPEYTTANAIGTPLAGAYANQGVYRRDFTGGVVFVNPSSTTAYTVSIPANTYKDLHGNLQPASITIAAASVTILLSQ